MNEETDLNLSAAPEQSDADIISVLKAMQQQLQILAKKVDLLLSRSQEASKEERPSHARSFGRKPFSKPFRSREHSPHYEKREREHSPRERDRDFVPGHFYERRPHEKRGKRPSPGKKPFAFRRKDRE